MGLPIQLLRESFRVGNWLKGEVEIPQFYSRDQVTLQSSPTATLALTTGMLLGKVTSNGKYVQLNIGAPVATVAGGIVTGVTGGPSGWLSAPTATATGGGGTGATVAVTATNGVLSYVVGGTMSGYTSAPTITLSGGSQDGSQAVAGILYLDTAVPATVDTQAVAITREATVMDLGLVYPAGATTAQIATAITQLAAMGIIVRRGA